MMRWRVGCERSAAACPIGEAILRWSVEDSRRLRREGDVVNHSFAIENVCVFL